MNNLLYTLMTFMERGGVVLWLIAALLVVVWSMVFERLWFYRRLLPMQLQQTQQQWQARKNHHSWHSHRIREARYSVLQLQIERGLPMISAMVALCPLLGLLGTVSGMIEVFSVMAMTGGSDARAMASGVGRATIPAMAGMVAALSGVAAKDILSKASQKQNQAAQACLNIQ